MSLKIPITKAIENLSRTSQHSIAICFEDSIIHYSELINDSQYFAKYLLGKYKVSLHDIAIIFLDKSIEMVTCTLSVLYAGAVFLPLDTRIPQGRLKYICNDSKASLIITSKKYEDYFKDSNIQIIYIEDASANTVRYDNILLPEIKASWPAYIIYTSGSTGLPKGAVIPHRSLMNLALSQSQILNINYSTRILQFASWGFDAAISEWSTAFINGGCLCIMPSRRSSNILSRSEYIAYYIEYYKISLVTLPTSILVEITFTYLPQTIISAGEPCNANVIKKYSKITNLFNGYGPSECAVCATMMKCSDLYPPSTIGKPIHNIKIHLVDQNNKYIQDALNIGEIYIGGDGVGLGYLNRDELTASKFITDPFSIDKKLYRTGDLGRYLPDGNIEYIGRLDNQIQLHGCRIELEEITNKLEEYKYVQKAFVVYSQHSNGQEINAYLALEAKKIITKQELIEFLQKFLPQYMLPCNYYILSVIPLTNNGKVDIKKLKEYVYSTL